MSHLYNLIYSLQPSFEVGARPAPVAGGEREGEGLFKATQLANTRLPMLNRICFGQQHCRRFSSVHSVQFSSFAQLCPILCDPMNRSTPGLLVHHQFPEFTQTHVHRVGDAIRPSHPLSSPSPFLNLSQHQRLQMSQLFA